MLVWSSLPNAADMNALYSYLVLHVVDESAGLYTYVCVCVFVSVSVCVFVSVSVCVHVSICVYIYIYEYVCIY